MQTTPKSKNHMKQFRNKIKKFLFEVNPYWRMEPSAALGNKKSVKNYNIVVIGNGGFAHTLRALIASVAMVGESCTRLYWRNLVHGTEIEALPFKKSLFEIPDKWIYSHKTYRSWVIPYLHHEGGNLLENAVLFNAVNKHGMWCGVGEYHSDELKVLKEAVNKIYVNSIKAGSFQRKDEFISPSLSIHIRFWYDLHDLFPIYNFKDLSGVIAREKFNIESLCYHISRLLDRYDFDRSLIYLASDDFRNHELIQNNLSRKFGFKFLNKLPDEKIIETSSAFDNDFHAMASSQIILRSKGSSFSHLAGMIGSDIKADYVF